MTKQELDKKLAYDIATIRMIVDESQKEYVHIDDYSERTVTAMKELDHGDEQSIIDEFEKILADEWDVEKINFFLTTNYLNTIINKLKIRVAFKATKKIKPFSEEDYAEAKGIKEKRTQDVVDGIMKALGNRAALSPAAAANFNNEFIVSASAAESYGFDVFQLSRHVFKKIKEQSPALVESYTRPSALYSMEMITFMSTDEGAVEYLEKVYYYNKWIYERFEPIGVILIHLNP